jgi:fido (protein-threonine AMPylation protein)
MSMAAYRGFAMRDCFCLPYQGQKIPIITLTQNQTWLNSPQHMGSGLRKNHPFNDANKRTALIAMRLFLKLNGYDLAASPEDKYKTIIRVAASDISENELAQWIRKNLEEIKS